MYDVPSISSRILTDTCLQSNLEEFYLKVGTVKKKKKLAEQQEAIKKPQGKKVENQARMMRKKWREGCFTKAGMVNCAMATEKHKENLKCLWLAIAGAAR